MGPNGGTIVNRTLARTLLIACTCTSSGCIVNSYEPAPQQSPAEVARMQHEIVPLVRSVPSADRAMLWQAARGFMDRAFGPQAIALRDETKQVVETHLIERVENGQAARTVVTVQIANDPALAGAARIGVIAQRIDARTNFGAAEDNRPMQPVWVLVGNNEVVAGEIADAILQRYLLLRAGRDPDAELPPPTHLGTVPRGG